MLVHSRNRKIYINRLVLLMLCFSGFSAMAQTIAFPGALGFGANATGGRAGKVYHVTTLADTGKGSFRDAVSSSNRIVVFDVSGYINLVTAVSVKNNITIAGQTAPGDGIGFAGGEISFASSSNIICRHIRIRPGSNTVSSSDDALSLYRAKNVIVDHCSIAFAPWNNIDGVSDDWQNYPVTDITFQNCLVADPTGQQFGSHCESVSSNWSWFYNVFANSHNRNPLAKVNDVFVNNVLYNCSAGYTTHTSTNFKHDLVNNYFIFGPASTGTDNTWYQVDKNQSIYYSGNLKDKNLNGVLDGAITTPYWYQGPGTILTSPWSAITSSVPVFNTQTAYHLTASLAGTLPRDQMDSLVFNQIKTLGSGTTGTGVGTVGPSGSLYTSQTQTGLPNNGYGIIRSGVKETDTDNDGMPDYWENAIGTNPAVSDAMLIQTNGYAQIESYFNWLADLHARTKYNTPIDIDLKQYSGGFSDVAPVFGVSNAVNGTVSLLADGHTARFKPTSNYYGLGEFSFSVNGTDTSVFSSKVKVLIEKPAIVPGCPVTVQLVSNLSSCDRVVYNGNTYTQSISLNDTIRNGKGCDSIYSAVNITINNNNVSGNLITVNGTVIPNAQVGIVGSVNVSGMFSGSFNFNCLANGTNGVIKAWKNNDLVKTNGVSTIDAALVQSHILQKSLLNSPYKIIAADVNGDGKVSALDIVFMKRLILGIDTSFAGNRLWTFVDSSFTFANASNPFPYKDSISIGGLNANKTNQTFIGIKLGDVNWDWNPTMAKPNQKDLKKEEEEDQLIINNG